MAAGEHRAPKSRERLNDYWWFCLEHVREYNRAWDFYAGMNETDIERHLRADSTWDRPTWPMGNWRTRERHLRDKMAGGGHAFGRDWSEATPEDAPRRRPLTPEEEAMQVLGLPPGTDFTAAKTRYRELAKMYHPDMNGGDRDAEERLKRINQAYNTLKTAAGVG